MIHDPPVHLSVSNLRRCLRFWATVLAFACSLPAAADCGDYAGNLLADLNCDADHDAMDWTALEGTVSFEALDGVPPGSVRVDSEMADLRALENQQAILVVCVDVSGDNFSVSLAAKVISGNATCSLESVRIRSDVACSGSVGTSSGFQVRDFADDLSTWSVASAEATFLIGDRASAEFIVFCADGDPFSVLFDNAYFLAGDAGAPIFTDGFEDGDLGHW